MTEQSTTPSRQGEVKSQGVCRKLLPSGRCQQGLGEVWMHSSGLAFILEGLCWGDVDWLLQIWVWECVLCVNARAATLYPSQYPRLSCYRAVKCLLSHISSNRHRTVWVWKFNRAHETLDISSGSSFIFMLWQRCASDLVLFRGHWHSPGVVKRSCFGFCHHKHGWRSTRSWGLLKIPGGVLLKDVTQHHRGSDTHRMYVDTCECFRGLQKCTRHFTWTHTDPDLISMSVCGCYLTGASIILLSLFHLELHTWSVSGTL